MERGDVVLLDRCDVGLFARGDSVLLDRGDVGLERGDVGLERGDVGLDRGGILGRPFCKFDSKIAGSSKGESNSASWADWCWCVVEEDPEEEEGDAEWGFGSLR
jgi:hypothetical protein